MLEVALVLFMTVRKGEEARALASGFSKRSLARGTGIDSTPDTVGESVY
jgi:hypothetical protein